MVLYRTNSATSGALPCLETPLGQGTELQITFTTECLETQVLTNCHGQWWVPCTSCLYHWTWLPWWNLAQAKQPKVYEVHWTWEAKGPPPLDEPESVSIEVFFKAGFWRPPCLGPGKLTLTENCKQSSRHYKTCWNTTPYKTPWTMNEWSPSHLACLTTLPKQSSQRSMKCTGHGKSKGLLP